MTCTRSGLLPVLRTARPQRQLSLPILFVAPRWLKEPMQQVRLEQLHKWTAFGHNYLKQNALMLKHMTFFLSVWCPPGGGTSSPLAHQGPAHQGLAEQM